MEHTSVFQRENLVMVDMLDGLTIIPAKRFDDQRGFFTELYNEFQEDIPQELKANLGQVNISYSHAGVIRGMHYQYDPPMGKYLRLIQGEILLVELDIRPNSPTFGKPEAIYMTTEKTHFGEVQHFGVWIPVGFANGFFALKDSVVAYACTGHYNPQSERSINPLSDVIRPIWEHAYTFLYKNKRNVHKFSPIISEKDCSSKTFEYIVEHEMDQFINPPLL